MARFKEITLQNFKAQNCTDQLSGLDLYIGPNGVGKSSRQEAMALAILGYVPGRQKKADEIMKLSEGEEMSVGLSMEGMSFSRTFQRTVKRNTKTRTKTASISETVEVHPSKKGENNTQKKQRITDACGDFTVHLDFQEFLDKSAAKRREFLLDLASSGDGWSKDMVAEELRKQVLTEELREGNAEAYRIAESMIADSLKLWKEGMTVEDGVQSMLEWADTEQKFWNSKRKDAEGAVRQLSEIKNRVEETDRMLDELKTEQEDLQNELVKTEKQLTSAEGAIERNKKRTDRMEEIKARLQELKDLAGPPETEAMEKEIQELRGQMVEAGEGDTTELDQEIATFKAKVKELQKQIEAQKAKRMDLEAECRSLNRAKETACKNTGEVKGKKVQVCVIDRRIACPKDFTPFLEFVDGKVDKLQEDIDKMLADEDALVKQVEAAELSIEEAEKKKALILLDFKQAHQKNAGLRSKIEDLERKIKELDNKAQALTSEYQAHEVELQKLEEAGPEAIPAEAQILQNQCAGIRKRLEEIKNEIQKQEQQRNTLANMQTSLVESEEADSKHLAAKDISKVLGTSGIQGQLLKGGLNTLSEDIQQNMEYLGVDPSRRFGFRTEDDNGKEIFDFGWYRGEQFISYDALSTGQRILLVLSIATALLDRANPPVKVMALDNVENLDDHFMRRMLQGLKELQEAGKLDNVIIAMVGRENKEPDAQTKYVLPEGIDGWSVHELEEKA